MLNDIRYALRSLKKRPGFTGFAVLTLGLGIGATAAILAVVDSTLIRPFDLPARDRLVALYVSDERQPFRSFVYSDYVDLRAVATAFTGLAAYAATDLSLAGGGAPERVSGQMVSTNYFSVLGVVPAAGRTLRLDDGTPNAGSVAVVSAALARRQFGDVDIAVGRTLRLNGNVFTVVGVVPSRFKGTVLTGAPEVWVPMAAYRRIATGFFANFDAVDYAAQRGPRRIGLWQVVGRLQEGVGLPTAQLELDAIARRLAEEYPATNAGRSILAVPATQAAVPPMHRTDSVRFLGILTATALLTLLIACANVANLFLARAVDRAHEVGVRMALGAGRARVARESLAESMIVALAGTGAGILVAYWTVDLLGAFRLPGGVPLDALDLAIDLRFLVVAAALSALTAVTFGSVPALWVSRSDPSFAMRERSVFLAAGRIRLRQSLVTLQVALGLVLIVGAALFARSLQRAFATDPGFDPRGVVTVTVHLGEQRYRPLEAERLFDALLRRVAVLPGVTAAGVTSTPFGEAGIGVGSLYTPDRNEPLEVDRVTIARASEGYFAAAGMTLREGRAFTASDDAAAPHVAVVNEAVARRLWPGTSPLGKQLNFSGPSGRLFTVVGVVRNAMYEELGERDALHVFLSLRQHRDAAAGDPMTLYVRSSGDPESLVGPVRRVVGELDPHLPIFDVMALEDRLASTLGEQRFGRALLGGLAFVALVLAAMGVYAVTADAVARRTREFGIRMALGADAHRVSTDVLTHAAGPVALGLTAGVMLALLGGRLAAGVLYGVSPHDAVSFATATVVLAVTALVAAWIPARRAARVDPVEALRIA